MTRAREDTTTFVEGKCQRCGWRSHSQDVHGEACDRCGRRVTWPAERIILVSCGWCGDSFGRNADLSLAAMDAHYQTCTDWLKGDGLLKERPIRYAYEDKTGAEG